ncbi:MAG: hypothetical protein JWP97_3760 [Labilithrix sp.]|nr:hypothetical protein [Labilithrix sp.]
MCAIVKTSSIACAALALTCMLLDASPAAACGGCFTAAPERTVVTDHRMALAVSTRQTVLWDQIRYSGDPSEFAWVLPVHAGATIELSNDEFFSALDASSQPVVYPPPTYGGGMGCGLAGCSMSSSDSAMGGAPGSGQVQILAQSVVGPYETVTLRATDPSALRTWLKSHAFQIPDAIAPTIDAYVAESFDFLALRLRPDCGERAMRPVRIVTPGADPTLPLRMVAAGIGAKVGLTLYVISEGPYEPRNFPHAVVDHASVQWDRVQNRSNYEALTEQLMAERSGRTWVVEYADKPQLFTDYDPRFGGGRAPGYVSTGTAYGTTPGLADAYYGQCRAPGAILPPTSPSAGSSPTASPFTPCPDGTDAGAGVPPDAASPVDAGTVADAGSDPDSGDELDAGTDPDADTDAGDADVADAADAGGPTPPGDDGGLVYPPPSQAGVCLYLDDLDVAMRGLHPRDVWVTRLRASLPVAALSAGDLVLEPAAAQERVSNVYYAASYEDETQASAAPGGSSCVSAPKRRTAFGSWIVALSAAVAAVAVLRRWQRPRK